MLMAICLDKPPGAWGRVYTSFTEVIVFGAIASFVIANVTRRYRPEATCAALASGLRGHLVVIGYSNLGRRLVEMAEETGTDVVVVEDDRDLVDPLVLAEKPLILGDLAEEITLTLAGVARADTVVIATDDLEAAAVACRVVRNQNPRCKLVVRCPDEDVGQSLAKAYNAKALSTSKAAVDTVLAAAKKAGSRRALVLGANRIGKRVAEALGKEQISTTLIPETEDAAAIERAGAKDADLVIIADDDLGKNLVRVDRIRDVSPDALVLCRVFHEEAAQILAQKPFRCVLLSSSRLAADALAREGLLRSVGIAAKRRPKGAPSPTP